MLTAIFCTDKYNVMGYEVTDSNGNKNFMMPWGTDNKEDLNYFKNITTGDTVKAILMGYNTFKSIGRVLPCRINIIISGKHYNELKEEFKDNKLVHIYKSYEEFYLVWEPLINHEFYEIMIIGGAQLLNAHINEIKFIYKTVIDLYEDKLDKSKFNKVIYNSNDYGKPNTYIVIKAPELDDFYVTLLNTTENYRYYLYTKNKSI